MYFKHFWNELLERKNDLHSAIWFAAIKSPSLQKYYGEYQPTDHLNAVNDLNPKGFIWDFQMFSCKMMSLGVTHACQSVIFYIYRTSFIIITQTYVNIMSFF